MRGDNTTLAVVLGIVGVVTGTVGAVVGSLAYLRDRSRLAVEWTVQLSGETSLIHLLVVNEGQRPSTLREVGFVPKRGVALRALLRLPLPVWAFRLISSEWREGTVQSSALSLTDKPVRVEPGDHFRKSLRARNVLQALSGVEFIQPFARESAGKKGKVTWGAPLALGEIKGLVGK